MINLYNMATYFITLPMFKRKWFAENTEILTLFAFSFLRTLRFTKRTLARMDSYGIIIEVNKLHFAFSCGTKWKFAMTWNLLLMQLSCHRNHNS
jgi:hypothetical protein